MVKPLSQTEIVSFINSLNPSKALGTTGITTGVYQYLFKIIPNVITEAVNNTLITRTIPVKQREGAIVLIPKTGKDQRIISNLRPITLLNTLYKVVSGCVTARMKPVLDRIIQPWQKAYINGRYIGEVTRTCYDIFNHANVFNKPGLLILIDSICFNLILSTMRIFDFPE